MLNFVLPRRTITVWAVASVLAMSACASKPQASSNASAQSSHGVAATIAAKPELSTLSALIIKADLTSTLNGAGNFTVFAPSNEAFKAVPQKTMEDLAANPVMLKEVLTYHVLPVKAMAADVKTSNAKTINGGDIALSKAGDFVTVENAIVQMADITASNGVVHVIDSVLLPPKKK
jgi:uncharacterized surface protein with fasciclin (FAS1) repeats